MLGLQRGRIRPRIGAVASDPLTSIGPLYGSALLGNDAVRSEPLTALHDDIAQLRDPGQRQLGIAMLTEGIAAGNARLGAFADWVVREGPQAVRDRARAALGLRTSAEEREERRFEALEREMRDQRFARLQYCGLEEAREEARQPERESALSRRGREVGEGVGCQADARCHRCRVVGR